MHISNEKLHIDNCYAYLRKLMVIMNFSTSATKTKYK